MIICKQTLKLRKPLLGLGRESEKVFSQKSNIFTEFEKTLVWNAQGLLVILGEYAGL